MMKLLLVFQCAFLSALCGHTQVLPYLFTVVNEPYTQLQEATSLNGNSNWEDPDYLIPIGFDFYGFGEWNNELTFGGVFGYGGELFLGSFDGSEPFNHLCPYGLDIHDPNVGTNLAPSGHIFQKLEGTAPNRICKLEWRNVGFYLDTSGEMRMNFQMWLYETTNMIEYRYGPSTNFDLSEVQELNGILVGLSKDFDFNSFTFNYLWTLNGNANDPSIEAYDSFSIDFQIADQILQNPDEGTVYRFNNLEINIEDIDNLGWNIFPNPTSEQLQVQCPLFQPQQGLNIKNQLGQVVVATTLQNTHTTIDVSILPPGVYMVEVINSDKSHCKRLIVQ